MHICKKITTYAGEKMKRYRPLILLVACGLWFADLINTSIITLFLNLP